MQMETEHRWKIMVTGDRPVPWMNAADQGLASGLILAAPWKTYDVETFLMSIDQHLVFG